MYVSVIKGKYKGKTYDVLHDYGSVYSLIDDNGTIISVSKKDCSNTFRKNKNNGKTVSFTGYENKTKFMTKIIEECKFIEEFLIEKTKKYGDSLFVCDNVFYKKDNQLDGINKIIDHKLARIKNAPDNEDEDQELDIIGYLIAKRIIKKMRKDEN